MQFVLIVARSVVKIVVRILENPSERNVTFNKPVDI